MWSKSEKKDTSPGSTCPQQTQTKIRGWCLNMPGVMMVHVWICGCPEGAVPVVPKKEERRQRQSSHVKLSVCLCLSVLLHCTTYTSHVYTYIGTMSRCPLCLPRPAWSCFRGITFPTQTQPLLLDVACWRFIGDSISVAPLRLDTTSAQAQPAGASHACLGTALGKPNSPLPAAARPVPSISSSHSHTNQPTTRTHTGSWV
jgi:hypothetical protein